MPSHQADSPSLPLYLSEFPRAVGDFVLWRAASPLAPLLPQGDGRPVLVLPGLLADDRSTRTLRTVLRRLGHRVHGWRLGRNIGPTAACVDGMRALVVDLHERYGQPITIVGWSLGGIFARQLARDEPGRVRQVVTLSSPFRLASADQSRAHTAFERYAHLHVAGADLPLEQGAVPLAVPATSLYSRLDGVVAWEACLDTPGPQAENIAVLASHLGIGHHPAALYAVADRLAQPDGDWSPFEPHPLLRLAFPRADVPAGRGRPRPGAAGS